MSFNSQFDQAAYGILKRCSDAKDMTEWNEWRERNPEKEIYLQGADLKGFFLQKANFENAHCEGANFQEARCEGADFSGAHCEGANFSRAYCMADFCWAHCEGAQFTSAHCEGAEFSFSYCEGTSFWFAYCQGASFLQARCGKAKFIRANCAGTIFVTANCEEADFSEAYFDGKTNFSHSAIDNFTDFSRTPLEIIKITPGQRAKLEQNIRRFEWEWWYVGKRPNRVKPWRRYWNIIKTSPVRFFWWLSDYGYSTPRILKSFAVSVFLFACIYTIWPQMLDITGAENLPLSSETGGRLAHFFRMLAFAASTMVTLGFSNINVAVTEGVPHWGGLFVVTCNLLWGYFLLAVLVTRLGIMFQTLGPGYVVPKKRKGKAGKGED
jgi:hypothetical protein